ncbi:C2 NT-type domain-containing protein [Pseudozyma hubeiensis]|nr:C2 NT-type domain-containing protein [Pseudozyma hubeiensis]
MSLLSPFGFGQKHSYFHVELTIHELTNVPLVTGLFACKWKVKGSHSLASLQHSAAAAVHQQTSRVVSSASRKAHIISTKDPASSVHAADHESGSSNNLSLGAPHDHGHGQRQASGSTTADSASIFSQSSKDASQHSTHKPSFLSNTLHPYHPHHDRQSHHTSEDSSQPSSATQPKSPDLTQPSSSQASLATADTADASSTHSRSRRDSTTSRKTSNSRTKSLKDLVHSKGADSHHHNVDPLLFFNQEPKGETDFVKVEDHKVEWERDIQVGMRIGIGKPRTSPPSSHHDSPSVSAKSSAKDLRSRAHREQHLDDLSTAWGRLTQSELKLTIRQEMPANVKSTTHPNVLGNVVLDLSEFAPDPPVASSSGRHRHHHHHRHHHNHPHHYHYHVHHPPHHGPGGEHSYRSRTCRSETRKFLLNGSKTNATVKITITMTFLGGAKEYYVPPISNGLMVNGLGSLIAPALLESSHDSAATQVASDPASSKSSGSESSSLRHEPIRASASTRNRELMGSGLPSASSFSLHNFDSSGQSQHNVYGPPLRSIYAKKTWTNRIPEENLVAAAPGSEETKRKPKRTSEASFLTSRTQSDRAPDDVINAIFKGIPVGGSHLGQVRDDAAAAKVAAARASRAERATAALDLQTGQSHRKPSKSPERTRERIRTMSSASSLSKKSERSFSFGLGRAKDKDKDKDKKKEKELKQQDKGKTNDKDTLKAHKDDKKPAKSKSTTDAESVPGHKVHGFHLGVPGSNTDKMTPDLLVESPSASTDALPRTNSDSAIAIASPAARSSPQRISSIRWDLGGAEDVASEARPSQETTPVAETLTEKEERDRAAMPPPPSVVVNHPYIPIRAGGVTAASSSDVHLAKPPSSDAPESKKTSDTEAKADQTANALLSPTALPTTSRAISSETVKDADAASLRSTSSSVRGAGDGRKLSSNDLKGLYQAGLAVPQSLSNSTAVGLERLKRTSRAIGQFAKDAARSSRPSSRPNSSSSPMPLHDSQGVSGRERQSKGNRGIEPSEAASKGWQGAGWLRPISTAPVPLPPGSPDLSSSDGEDSEQEGYADAGSDPFSSRASRASDDGRRSSATDQTALSDTLDTPGVSASETLKPIHKRENSFASVYHDVEEDSSWMEAQEPPPKPSFPAMTPATLPA